MARLLRGGNFAVLSVFPSTVHPPSYSTSFCNGLASSFDDFSYLNLHLTPNRVVGYCVDNGTKLKKRLHIVGCARGRENTAFENASEIECLGTGLDVECVVTEAPNSTKDEAIAMEYQFQPMGQSLLGTALLISPFFFWGSAMVAMKEVIPQVGPFAIAAYRLVPAGFLLVAFAAKTGRPMPSGFNAWLSIILFAFVDGSLFQGFLAEGLQRTAAGLGSVIIDSQPLTVAILAAIFFGESIGYVGAAGLVLGVIGLLLLELPTLLNQGTQFSLWGSGEWWMLLAAQSMAVGTIMVRWVSKYSDPIMATGWHMVIGGLPLAAATIALKDPSFSGNFNGLSSWDIFAILYASVFGGAVSYGVYFYNASKGSLTKLSSLTFLTPMFASLFGFLFLGETFTPLQYVGVFVTIVGIYMVNF